MNEVKFESVEKALISPLEFYKILEGIVQSYNLSSLQPHLMACKKHLEKGNQIDIGILGRFKAGKSSFLNHIAGRDVLPIGVIPLTTVITRLRYGETPQAVVHFLNSSSKIIPVEKVSEFVGEKENPKNYKNVDYVDIELPELKAYHPLQFVDTPGLESVLSHNTKTSLNWLPNVSAALVAISCDAPLSEPDLALISEVANFTSKIVILFTKADLLSEENLREIEAFALKQLENRFGKKFPIYFYSTKPSHQKFRSILEQELFRPLIENSGVAASEITEFKLKSLCRACVSLLKVAYTASIRAENAKAELLDKLGEERKELNQFKEELLLLANQWTAAALDFYLEKLRPEQAELQSRLRKKLKEEIFPLNLKLPAMMSAYGKWLHKELDAELKKISESKRNLFYEPAVKTKNYLNRSYRAFHDRLAQHVYECLGINITIPEFELEIPEIEEPPIDVSAYFMIPMDIIGNVFPTWLVKPFLQRNLRRRVFYEVEKNLSRLSSDWRDRIGSAIKQLCSKTLAHMEEEIKTIEGMLSIHKTRKDELEKVIGRLESLLNGSTNDNQ